MEEVSHLDQAEIAIRGRLRAPRAGSTQTHAY